MRKGAERRLCIELNPSADQKYAREIMHKLKEEAKEKKRLYSGIEKMLSKKSKDIEIRE